MLRGIFYLTVISAILLVIRIISTAPFRSLTPDAARHNISPTATPSEVTLLILGTYNSVRTELSIKEASDAVQPDTSSEPVSKLNHLQSSHALIVPLLSSSASEPETIREPALLRIRKRSSISLESSQTISKLAKRTATLHFPRELSDDNSLDARLLPLDRPGNQREVPLRDILSSYDRAYRMEKAADRKAGKKRAARKKKMAGMKLAVLGSDSKSVQAKVSKAGRGKASRND